MIDHWIIYHLPDNKAWLMKMVHGNKVQPGGLSMRFDSAGIITRQVEKGVRSGKATGLATGDLDWKFFDILGKKRT